MIGMLRNKLLLNFHHLSYVVVIFIILFHTRHLLREQRSVSESQILFSSTMNNDYYHSMNIDLVSLLLFSTWLDRGSTGRSF